MDDQPPTTAELLEAWRETTRAADLADRLARIATESAEAADQTALDAEKIATMAERAAVAAERAAKTARIAAVHARDLAREHRDRRMVDANDAVSSARADEVEARDRYHQAEADAHQRNTPER